jgi:hypothetical protein
MWDITLGIGTKLLMVRVLIADIGGEYDNRHGGSRYHKDAHEAVYSYGQDVRQQHCSNEVEG